MLVLVHVKECRPCQPLAEASMQMSFLSSPWCKLLVAGAKHKVDEALLPMQLLGSMCPMHSLGEVQGAGKVQGQLLDEELLPVEVGKAEASKEGK